MFNEKCSLYWHRGDESVRKCLMPMQPLCSLDATKTTVMLAGVEGLSDAAARLLPRNVWGPLTLQGSRLSYMLLSLMENML